MPPSVAAKSKPAAKAAPAPAHEIPIRRLLLRGPIAAVAGTRRGAARKGNDTGTSPGFLVASK